MVVVAGTVDPRWKLEIEAEAALTFHLDGQAALLARRAVRLGVSR